MNARQDIERLAGRALLDKEFRARLLSHPHEVAQEAGVRLTEDQIKALQSFDTAKIEEWEMTLGNLMTPPIGAWLPPTPGVPKEPPISKGQGTG